ncbi:aminotransferase-like domain-containing protein [Caballeronia concitans]|uniref:GntR family transcriptional regulator n=1 Tax=Caballeronia concitans TaxID=1777133 RepID=A0A658QUW4_9BURK|nr:PLP-dependent aminotransferase family protein [Caballeronia concitans]KIG07589.1 transcriptional regulator, GntR family with aminotransferase domain containing protein [Burkholderia sp. MR1]SAL23468.1 GntR family transcriptional regulator [Caballeronia concitans]
MTVSHSSADSERMKVPETRDSTLLEELRVERQRGISLVGQIVAKLEQMVESGRLRAGTKTPSVRELAKQLGVSTFTVTEAYDVLVSKRVLSSRPGSGYFVTARVAHVPVLRSEALASRVVDPDAWMPVLVWNRNPDLLPVGSGVLPPEWCSESMILQAVRQAIKMPAERLVGYGHPLGFYRLRQLLARGFTERFCAVAPEQIILTNGVSHGLDLVVRSLLKPGDTVLIEDPTYFNIHHLLRSYGVKVVSVKRNHDGIDLDQLASLAALHRPKAMYVNTVLQNPLSTTLSPAQAYRIIALAEQFDFLIIEDDIFRDLASPSDPSLASLDGLNRVICLGGFSKTVAPSLRTGYILCPGQLVSDVVRTKMACGLTTSELNERCILEVLSDPGHRRYLDRLRMRLANEREQFLSVLTDVGMTALATPKGGLFVSAGWLVPPSAQFNAELITEKASEAGLAFSRGELFSLSAKTETVWFRFNVAYCGAPKLNSFLREVSRMAAHLARVPGL